MHLLRFERAPREHLAPEGPESVARTGHFEVAQCGAHGLRGEARIGQLHTHRHHRAVEAHLEHLGIRVAVAEGIHTVEHVVRAPVPEVAEIEHRVDHRGRVARGDLAGERAVHVELVGRAVVAGLGAGRARAGEVAGERALRGHHVVALKEHRRVTVKRVGEFVEREVRRLEGVVRPATAGGRAAEGVAVFLRALRAQLVEDLPAGRGGMAAERVVAGLEARTQLVLEPVVGAGREVAARAGIAVAAHLGIPEQGLAEHDRRLAVADVSIEPRHLGNLYGFERHQLGDQVEAAERRGHRGHRRPAVDRAVGGDIQQRDDQFPRGGVLRHAERHARRRPGDRIQRHGDIERPLAAQRVGGNRRRARQRQHLLGVGPHVGGQVRALRRRRVQVVHQGVEAGATGGARADRRRRDQHRQEQREAALPGPCLPVHACTSDFFIH